MKCVDTDSIKVVIDKIVKAEVSQGIHYDNISMQYTENFNGSKNYNFQFAQNIDCGYMLELPQ